jgi:hypothetical protein
VGNPREELGMRAKLALVGSDDAQNAQDDTGRQ